MTAPSPRPPAFGSSALSRHLGHPSASAGARPVPGRVPVPGRAPSAAGAREPSRATTTSQRVLAPDVARGLALLGIAIANAAFWFTGRETGLLFKPLDGSALDRAADVVGALVIDNRCFPMFAFLFAYGFHMMWRRELARGQRPGAVQLLLVRRSAILLVVGLLHSFLLFSGDIIATYALVGFALALLVRAPSWVIWIVGALATPFLVVISSFDAGRLAWSGFSVPSFDMQPSAAEPTILDALSTRVMTEVLPHLPSMPLGAIAMLPPMALGLLAARARLVDRPWEHPRLAIGLTIGGLGVGLLGALPIAIGSGMGTDEGDPLWMLAAVLHGLTGALMGPAYAIGAGLLLARVERARLAGSTRRPGVVAGALAALGRRSMSGYLAQSVLGAIVYPVWALGLGASVGTAAALAISLGIWLVTLVAAWALDRADVPGPAEWLVRRLTYGRATRRGGAATQAAGPPQPWPQGDLR